MAPIRFQTEQNRVEIGSIRKKRILVLFKMDTLTEYSEIPREKNVIIPLDTLTIYVRFLSFYSVIIDVLSCRSLSIPDVQSHHLQMLYTNLSFS